MILLMGKKAQRSKRKAGIPSVTREAAVPTIQHVLHEIDNEWLADRKFFLNASKRTCC
jgi:hypothetical protein